LAVAVNAHVAEVVTEALLEVFLHPIIDRLWPRTHPRID
jgi:hypothetical protein